MTEMTANTGRAVLQLTADKTYTRHSEGAFLRMNDGSILYAYSRFTGSDDDGAPSDIVGLWSKDEGETWSEPVTLLRAADFNTHNIMSVSLMRMQNGDVGLFFGARHKPSEGLRYLARSNDECKSFYKTTLCSLSDRPGYYVLNNDRVIRLKSGRLVMPTAFHRGGYDWEYKKRLYFDSCGVLCFVLSDDDGETWAQKYAQALLGDYEADMGAMERIRAALGQT